MSEAIWIELIKVLPAFLWIGFGFIALAVAKRVFSAQAPRMTKVETPWVTVELAQQAIEQASVRGTAADAPPFEPNWYPPLPAQRNDAGFGQPVPPGNGTVPPPPDFSGPVPPGNGTVPPPPVFTGPVPPGGAPGGPVPQPGASPTGGPAPTGGPPPPLYDAMEDREDDAFPTEQRTDSDAKVPNTPPADEPSDNAPGNGGRAAGEAPPSPVTEPNRQIPNVPPTYPIRAAPPGNPGGYYVQPPNHTMYAAAPPLPRYQAAPGMYQPADAQRGLRAATKLALSADVLQGGVILWVDDHHEWNEPLIRLFRTAGMTVDAVASTPRAVLALKDRSYDLVITDMRRSNEADGATAGIVLLDKMVAVGIPTPAVIFSDSPDARFNTHPRAVTSTSSPETLVDTVVDIVSARRVQSHGASWFDRLRS